jgi:uncharacterized protein YdcH (DUF465 family)
MRKLSTTLVLALALSACARGESKTIEELIDIAKERIAAAEANAQDGMAAEVVKLKENLLALLDAANSAQVVEAVKLSAVSQEITALVPKASPTSRAALTELSKQYGLLGASGEVSADQVRLLVARTLHSIASELETNKFSAQ